MDTWACDTCGKDVEYDNTIFFGIDGKEHILCHIANQFDPAIGKMECLCGWRLDEISLMV